jgi:two-component system phosphate regulon sensor histidine kinase PhoR
LAVIENGRLLVANPPALQALRLTSASFDRKLNVEGPDGNLLERMIEALPPSQNASFEYRIVTRRGQTRFLRIEVVPVGPAKIVAQINDITILRDIESRREQAVANTSHELKTPLAVMNLGLSNLLSFYERMPDHDRREMIEETLDQVTEMKTLISSLPRRNKRGTQSFVEPMLVADPVFEIEQVVNELKAFSRLNQVRVNWLATQETAQSVRCTASDLKTVARNLLTNAIKYTRPGGSVEVSASISSDLTAFVLRVSDTGVGIPAEELERIFERSYRASTSEGVEGSGLGLSFVREIVGRAGGVITVESDVGSGTTFVVTLPWVQE